MVTIINYCIDSYPNCTLSCSLAKKFTQPTCYAFKVCPPLLYLPISIFLPLSRTHSQLEIHLFSLFVILLYVLLSIQIYFDVLTSSFFIVPFYFIFYSSKILTVSSNLKPISSHCSSFLESVRSTLHTERMHM